MAAYTVNLTPSVSYLDTVFELYHSTRLNGINT